MICLILSVLLLASGIYLYEGGAKRGIPVTSGDYIKWVDFDVSSEALKKACLLDVESYESEVHLDWITLLAYAAVRGGGKFNHQSAGYIDDIAKQLTAQEITKEGLAEKYKHFSYYYEAYQAVLGGMVGEYEIADDSGKLDMMGLIGTPIIAVESGYVEALGWNRYGGWRIGIRSFDKKRYYYYAHLRQNRPYADGLKEGDYVTAGDVIGYMGHTGYSDKENVNNIKTVHLHMGLQLIFDESQKDGNNEIWIDFYQLAGFLSGHRCEVERDDSTKEWDRKYNMKDPVVLDAVEQNRES